MRRTTASLLDQRTDSRLTRTTYRCHIIRVEFAAHALAVNGVGYSGPRQVEAAPAIAFGSPNAPRVFRGNDCLVTKDLATGRYMATQYIPTNTCVPSAVEPVPFQTTPVIIPPIVSFPPLPPVVFPPLPPPPPVVVPPILPPLPPPGTGGNAYDIGDGLLAPLSAGTLQQMLFFLTVRPWTINLFTMYCADLDVTLYASFGAVNTNQIVAYRAPTGIWQVSIYNYAGAALDSFVLASADTIVVPLSGADQLAVPGGGQTFSTSFKAGANAVQAFAYGMGGYT